MSEDSLIETRKAKHQEVNGGIYPLATNELVSSIASLLADIGYMIGENEIRTTIDLTEAKGNGTRILHGRIAAVRKSGALTFIKLTDSSGSMQLVATRNNFQDYDRFRLLDLGDIVEVTGEPVLTKTGERSLLLSDWKVLAKAHRPPPEKFAGITDTELKYRKRYLDLMSSEDTKSLFIIRSLVVGSIRSAMEQMGFIEVETPTLNTINSGANAKPFTTHHNSLDMNLYLRIAPELYLKRLLVGGFDKVFEIGKSYRNEGLSTRHNPEFSMIELYEAYGSFQSLFDYATFFINNADNYIRTRISSFNNYSKEYYNNCLKNRTFTLNTFKRVKIIDAVRSAMAKASLTTGDDFSDVFTICNTGNERLPKIDLKSLHHDLDKCLSIGQRIGVLFEYVAEPFLTDDYRTDDGKYSCPVFITDYPSELCPLARPQDNNPNICDRFELYIDGRELCNAYQELNDPDEQAQRFQDQLESNDKDPMDFDADYIEALQQGMPPAIGFGMGIDRLVMLLTGAPSIKDVILFPTLKPLK